MYSQMKTVQTSDIPRLTGSKGNYPEEFGQNAAARCFPDGSAWIELSCGKGFETWWILKVLNWLPPAQCYRNSWRIFYLENGWQCRLLRSSDMALNIDSNWSFGKYPLLNRTKLRPRSRTNRARTVFGVCCLASLTHLLPFSVRWTSCPVNSISAHVSYI